MRRENRLQVSEFSNLIMSFIQLHKIMFYIQLVKQNYAPNQYAKEN